MKVPEGYSEVKTPFGIELVKHGDEPVRPEGTEEATEIPIEIKKIYEIKLKVRKKVEAKLASLKCAEHIFRWCTFMFVMVLGLTAIDFGLERWAGALLMIMILFCFTLTITSLFAQRIAILSKVSEELEDIAKDVEGKVKVLIEQRRK